MMTDIVMEYEVGTKIQLLSPVVHHEKGTQYHCISETERRNEALV